MTRQRTQSIGTTRRNPYTGDQLRVEHNQFGEPMGSRDPMFPGGSGAGHGSNLDAGVFAPRQFPGAPIARSPLAPTMRPTGIGQGGGLRTGALRTGTLAPPMLRPRAQFPALQGSVATGATGREAMPAASSPASPGFPGGNTQRTATGLQSFQPDSRGGRMVGTTSPSLVPRGGGEGVVTNPGQTAFDEKGMQSADTTSGPARIYDPRRDTSKTFLDAGGNATVPGVGTFPGGPALPAGANGTPSVRGVMIDPKYQTPGASPIGVISGGTVSDGRTFPGARPAPPSATQAATGQPGAKLPAGTIPGLGGPMPQAATRLGFGDLHVAESATSKPPTQLDFSTLDRAAAQANERIALDRRAAEQQNRWNTLVPSVPAPSSPSQPSLPRASLSSTTPLTNDQQAGALADSLRKGADTRMARDEAERRKKPPLATAGFPGMGRSGY